MERLHRLILNFLKKQIKEDDTWNDIPSRSADFILMNIRRYGDQVILHIDIINREDQPLDYTKEDLDYYDDKFYKEK